MSDKLRTMLVRERHVSILIDEPKVEDASDAVHLLAVRVERRVGLRFRDLSNATDTARLHDMVFALWKDIRDLRAKLTAFDIAARVYLAPKARRPRANIVVRFIRWCKRRRHGYRNWRTRRKDQGDGQAEDESPSIEG